MRAHTLRALINSCLSGDIDGHYPLGVFVRKMTVGAALLGSLALASLLPGGAQADTVGTIDPGSFQITGGGGAGNAVVLGVSAQRTITVKLSASDNSGISVADFTLYHGTSLQKADAVLKSSESAPTCTATGTSTVCTRHFTISPKRDLRNALAGIWKVAVNIRAKDGEIFDGNGYTTFFMQRASRLTTNASPEPVTKGKTLTVTGKLSRANWDSHDYRGYADQRGVLQFRRPGTDYYETLGSTQTNSTGVLTAKVTASRDSYWRYNFTGTMTTPAVMATGDYVDVR
ncbi:calcium-binding protein [Streptomyces sp. NPDC056231]|uniref:calcium-binding protein n=1 Tax=Streptomyces sp. NPDC056231 TaxID=3345755 RepID=UPI003AAC4112